MDRRLFLQGIAATVIGPIVSRLSLPEIITQKVIEQQIKPAVIHIDGALEILDNIYRKAIDEIIQIEDKRFLRDINSRGR